MSSNCTLQDGQPVSHVPFSVSRRSTVDPLLDAGELACSSRYGDHGFTPSLPTTFTSFIHATATMHGVVNKSANIMAELTGIGSSHPVPDGDFTIALAFFESSERKETFKLWGLGTETMFLTFDLAFLLAMGRQIPPDERPMSNEMLILALYSQSKLSQDELNQLQKDTHFDKKELQQWYKGELMPSTHLHYNMLTEAFSI